MHRYVCVCVCVCALYQKDSEISSGGRYILIDNRIKKKKFFNVYNKQKFLVLVGYEVSK